MAPLTETTPSGFAVRFARNGSPDNSRVKGIVISDTHIGAPYADEEMAERVLYQELNPKNHNQFCVLLGDVYEGVNLPVKDMPKTDDEARALRTEKIKKYIADTVPVKEKAITDLMRRLPDVGEEELNLALGNHIMTNNGIRIVKPKGEKEIRDIYRKTRVRTDVESEAIGSHMDRLAKLVNSHPDCVFHYVIGNHERLPEYLDAICDLANEINEPGKKNRLNVVEDYLKIGDGLFIHGDQQLNPKKYHKDEPGKFEEAHAEMERSFWWQVVNDQGNKIVPELLLRHTIHRIKRSAEIILDWCHTNAPSMLEDIHHQKDIRHVFFGHTHVPYTNEAVVDKADGEKCFFHNTGAALSRFSMLNKAAFNPLRLTLDADPQKDSASIDPHVFYAGSSLAPPERIIKPDLQRA